MKSVNAACGLLLGLVLSAPLASAQGITLRSTDGNAEFSGELVDFNGTIYTIKTRLGTLNIPATEVSCSGDACPASNLVASEFRIAGDRSILRGAMPELLDAYSLEVDTDLSRERTPSGSLAFELLSLDGDPIVNVELAELDDTAAFEALIGAEATLAITSRRIDDSEAASLTGRDRRALDALGLERVIGLDGLVAVTGAEVGLQSISITELAGIYSGEITNWSEVGGIDSPISAFTREPGSDVRGALDRQVMAPMSKSVAANVIGVDSNDGVVNAVQTFPNSIGLTSFGAAGENDLLHIRDACGNEVAPNEFSIKSESYPLTMRLYLYERPGGIPVHARGLVDFAASDLGQQVIEDTGYLDLRPTPAGDQGPVSLIDANAEGISTEEVATIEALRAATSGAERLSTTFRPAADGSTLDGRGQVDLAQLTRMVRSGRLDGQELLFLGFPGPADGAVASGTEIARQMIGQMFARDRSVEEQITVGFRILGYSGTAISRCQVETSAANGRVEVWVKPLEQG